MEEWGNGRANQYYESNTPEDVYRPKETDPVKIVEKFIRNKYEHKKYIAKSVPPRRQNLHEVDIDHRKGKKTATKRTRLKLSNPDINNDVEPIIKSTVKTVPPIIQESLLIDLIDFNDEAQETLATPIIPSASHQIENFLENEVSFKEIVPEKEPNLINIGESDLIDFGDDINVTNSHASIQLEDQQRTEFVRNQQNIFDPSSSILSSDSLLSSNTKAEIFSASILSLYDTKDNSLPSNATLRKEGSSSGINLDINSNSNENNRNGSSIQTFNAMNGGINMNRMQFNTGLSDHFTAPLNNLRMMPKGVNPMSIKPESSSSNSNGFNSHSQYAQHQTQQNNHWQQPQHQRINTMQQRGIVTDDKRLHQNYVQLQQQQQQQRNTEFHINHNR